MRDLLYSEPGMGVSHLGLGMQLVETGRTGHLKLPRFCQD